MSTIIDETVILRYLLDDDKFQSPRAAKIIATRTARVYPEIITRTVVTLRDVYDVPREKIAEAMEALLQDVLVDEPTVCELAIRLFGRTKMDFTDCLLTARTAIYGDDIMSFGKPLIQGVMDYKHARDERAHGNAGIPDAARAQVASPGHSADRTIDQLRAAGHRRHEDLE